MEFLWTCAPPPQSSAAGQQQLFSQSTSPSSSSSYSADSESESESGDPLDQEAEHYSAPEATAPTAQSIPLLSGSVWLHCGAQGVRIWFPLEVGRQPSGGGELAGVGGVGSGPPPSPSALVRKQSSAYLTGAKASRRVMLSLRLDGMTYPLSKWRGRIHSIRGIVGRPYALTFFLPCPLCSHSP